ncbi:hypothetical protein ACLB2K_070339 [Fragaria x ananassa]
MAPGYSALSSTAGSLMGALSIPLHVPSSLAATEALALWHGVNYRKQLGVTTVVVKGNALSVLNALHSWLGLEQNWERFGCSLVTKREFKIFSWKHVNKRLNTVAHKLTRSALAMPQAMYIRRLALSG